MKCVMVTEHRSFSPDQTFRLVKKAGIKVLAFFYFIYISAEQN